MEQKTRRVRDLARRYTPSMFFRRVGFAILAVNAVGATLCSFYFMIVDASGLFLGLQEYPDVMFYMTVILLAAGAGLCIPWQKKIGQCWKTVANGEKPENELLVKAQRKVVNAPFFYSMVTLLLWVIAAIVMASVRYLFYVAEKGDAGPLGEAAWVLVGVLASGVFVTTVIFFYTDRLFHAMRAVFFTGGEIFELKHTLRLPVRARLLLALLMGGAFPILSLSAMVYRIASKLVYTNPYAIPSKLLYLMAFVLVLSLALIWFLTNMVEQSVASPIERLREAMGKVRRGDLDQAVPVASNDEVGYLADSYNKMLTSIELLHDLNQDIVGSVSLPDDEDSLE